MLYSPTGSAERNRAERRGQLPAVPKSRLTTTHLNKQQSKTLSTPNRDRARQKGSNKLLFYMNLRGVFEIVTYYSAM